MDKGDTYYVFSLRKTDLKKKNNYAKIYCATEACETQANPEVGQTLSESNSAGNLHRCGYALLHICTVGQE